VAAAPAPELAPSVSLKGEVWRHLRRDRLAVAGLVVLALLFVTALLGKLLTEWVVVFDPTLVRLPEKLLPSRARTRAAAPSNSLFNYCSHRRPRPRRVRACCRAPSSPFDRLRRHLDRNRDRAPLGGLAASTGAWTR
jgi:hypothetical protein